jgi:peptide/nickel transport system substrate-binding protein
MRNRAKMRRIAIFFLVAILLISVAPGCTTPTPEPTEEPAATEPAEPAEEPTEPAEPTEEPEPTEPPAEEEKVLVVAVANQYGETFDVFNTSTTMDPHAMIYEALVTVDGNYEFQPGLAESWEVSEDGLTWTFNLRQGVTFHDGSEFNAEVVKWWLEGMQEGVNSYMFESMESAEVVDEHTIQLNFPAPFPNLLYNLSASGFSGIMSKEAYEELGDDYGTQPVGTGPFMLEEWVQNDHLTLVKNPDYDWAPEWTGHTGPANVDKIIYRIIPEDATRSIELQSGNVHMLLDAPAPRELPQYQDNPDYLYEEFPSFYIQFIGMRVDHPVLSDIRTRRAIGHAIDREAIVENVFQGLGRPSKTYLPAELGGDKGVSEFAPGYDLEEAKRLLAEVGWVPGDDGILVAEDVEGVEPGTPFEVSYWTYQEDEFKRLAEVTQNMLTEVGIAVNTQLMDNPTYIDALKGEDTELILRQYGWDNNDILEWFHHSKYLPYPNYLGVEDPEFDAMLDEANFNTATWEARDEKYVDIHKYLIEEWYPWAPIRQPSEVIVGRSSVKNLELVPLRGTSSAMVWLQIDLEQ